MIAAAPRALKAGAEQWMLTPATSIYALADSLQHLSFLFNAIGETLHRQLHRTAGGLGWQNEAADATRTSTATQSSSCQEIAQYLQDASLRVADVAHSMDFASRHLLEVAARLVEAERDLRAAEGSPRFEDGTSDQALVEQARHNVTNLEGDCQHALQHSRNIGEELAHALSVAHRNVAAMNDFARCEGWVTSHLLPSMRSAFEEYDLIADPAEQYILDQADAGMSAQNLRKLLGELTDEEIAILLERHPQLAKMMTDSMTTDQFVEGDWAAHTSEAALAKALRQCQTLPNQQKSIEELWATFSEDERNRLALLYPGVVGSLGGIAPAQRFAANRVKVAGALYDLRQQRHDLEMTERVSKSFLGHASHRGWVDGERSEQWQSLDKRIAFYHSILNDDSTAGTGPRQILVFDNAGDGKFAEVFGTIDGDTENLGVFVPGTTTSMDSIGNYAKNMSGVAHGDSSGKTAMVVWMGTDLPDEVSNAVSASYAKQGSSDLVDFMVGLGVKPKNAAGEGTNITVGGHSYGGALVGLADAKGLPANNVVHLSSAGAGKGMWSVDDYATEDAFGNPRQVNRFSQTPRIDAINVSQGTMNYAGQLKGVNDVTAEFIAPPMAATGGVLTTAYGLANGDWQAIKKGVSMVAYPDRAIAPTQHWLNKSALDFSRTVDRFGLFSDYAHGGDPDKMEGVTQLHPGRYAHDFKDNNGDSSLAGKSVDFGGGPIKAHTDSIIPGSGAHDNFTKIVRGQPPRTR